jgi:micrococcal nuclease
MAKRRPSGGSVWGGRSRLLVLLAVLLSAIPALAAQTILAGDVTRVRDGDTIEVGKIPIRLNGVSAPEIQEALGLQSKAFMVNLVMGKRVRCKLDGTMTHDRWVGICYLNGQDIGAAIIGAGLALDCPRFSGGRYEDFEHRVLLSRIKLPEFCKK